MASSSSPLSRLSHKAVEEAIRTIAQTPLKPQTDSMLRDYLAFKAVSASGPHDEAAITKVLEAVVVERFTVLPTPDGVLPKDFVGTIRLRSRGGRPDWMTNDSPRGAFLDYAGPNGQGRKLFQGEVGWRRPLKPDAVDVVVGTLGDPDRYRWPERDALAAIALRNELMDASWGWDEIADHAHQSFGLTAQEWARVTSPPSLQVDPFDGDPWDPAKLADDLRPPGSEKTPGTKADVATQPPHLAAAIERVLDALRKHGERAIVALAGVPGTSKSYVARLAARAYASDGCLREIQFSPGYTYEEFIEGPRFGDQLKVVPVPGAFLELNERALNDPGKQYVLLIEELSRADLPKVLGELLTYVEYRAVDDTFTTMYRRDHLTRVAPNLAILATYNPTDRSAVTIDSAIIRRLRILNFPPDMDLLAEILTGNGVDQQVSAKLVAMFEACRTRATRERFDDTMPFGHAVFSSVERESDLYDLWHEELKQLMVRPRTPPHELYETIRDHYPWRTDRDYSAVVSPAPEVADNGSATQPKPSVE